MGFHIVFVAALVAGCCLLPTAEADFMSWLSETINRRLAATNGQGSVPVHGQSSSYIFNPIIQSDGVQDSMNNMVFSNIGNNIGGFGSSSYGSSSFISGGSVYKVSIQQQRGKDGQCKEKVTIGLVESNFEKTFDNKCSENGAMRSVTINGELLMIGNADNFLAFTSNKNEIFYLQDGKWMKESLSGDKKSQELTSSEVEAVKERIKNWREFLDKHNSELAKIREQKRAERTRFYQERNAIREQRYKERQVHYQNNNNIRQLRHEENKKRREERMQIYGRIRKEGWTTELKGLLSDVDDRYKKRMAELEEMQEEERKRYEDAMSDIEKKVEEAEGKSEEEQNRLDALEDEEEKKMKQEMEENIKQGW